MRAFDEKDLTKICPASSLSLERYNEFLTLLAKQYKGQNVSYTGYSQTLVNKTLKSIHSSLKRDYMFAFLFQAGKFFRALSNGVFVDQAGIQTLK